MTVYDQPDLPAVLLIGTLDTKGPEIAYVRDCLREEHGLPVLVLDSGILAEPLGIAPEITRGEVAAAAGEGESLEAIRAAGSRGAAVDRMRRGVARVALDLYRQGRIGGALCLGGAEGAVLGAAAMQALPIGVPKMVVSPLASGRRRFGPFVGTHDVMVMHSVIDILGINAVSRPIYRNVAAAMAGMVRSGGGRLVPGDRPTVAITMLGNTTTAVMHLKSELEAAGLDTVIFHANGVGGPAMEELIADGLFTGVIDYTLQELADNIVGGFHVAGPQRMDAAGRAGLPLVAVPGNVDFSVQGPRDSVPAHLSGRPSYHHNPEFTLVRLTGDEIEAVGHTIAAKLNAGSGPTCLVVPHGGLSIANVPGGELYDPEADARLFAALEADLATQVRRIDTPAHVNSPECAHTVAGAFLDLVSARAGNS
jgi:uncharacterized protein (UPF0261 family)